MSWKLGNTMEDVKVQALCDALTELGGNKTATAKHLQVSVRMVRIYIKQYDMLAKFRITEDPVTRKRPPTQYSLFKGAL